MSYTNLKVLSNNLKIANSKGRTNFLSIGDFLDMADSFTNTPPVFEEMIEESINQSIGKIATKEVTGLLGAPLAQLMSASVMFGEHLTDEDNFELHAIEQIGVQFKNIAKRGLWENDKLVLSAIEVASKYGLEQVVLDAVGIVRGKADVRAVLEDSTVVEELDDDFSFGTTTKKQNKPTVTVDDFNFSNL